MNLMNYLSANIGTYNNEGCVGGDNYHLGMNISVHPEYNMESQAQSSVHLLPTNT